MGRKQRMETTVNSRAGKRQARPDSRLTANLRVKGYMLCSEVAARVGVRKSTIYRWIHDGVIESLDFSGAYYVSWASVVQHLGEVGKVLGLTEEMPGDDGYARG